MRELTAVQRVFAFPLEEIKCVVQCWRAMGYPATRLYGARNEEEAIASANKKDLGLYFSSLLQQTMKRQNFMHPRAIFPE